MISIVISVVLVTLVVITVVICIGSKRIIRCWIKMYLTEQYDTKLKIYEAPLTKIKTLYEGLTPDLKSIPTKRRLHRNKHNYPLNFKSGRSIEDMEEKLNDTRTLNVHDNDSTENNGKHKRTFKVTTIAYSSVKEIPENSTNVHQLMTESTDENTDLKSTNIYQSINQPSDNRNSSITDNSASTCSKPEKECVIVHAEHAVTFGIPFD